MHQNDTLKEFILARTPSFTAPMGKDYAQVIAGLIINAEKRTQFRVSSMTHPQTIPTKDLMRPFSKGISDLSASLDASAIATSRSSFEALRKRGIDLVSPDMLYENSPKRMIRNTLESNSAVMEFAADMKKSISKDAFMMAKRSTFSDSERWLSTIKYKFGDRDIVIGANDPDGPLCYMHPSHSWYFHGIGWGATSSDSQKRLTSILNIIKTDPCFPRDITDEGITRLLFSQEVASDYRNATLILGALGCSAETLAEVAALFNTDSTRAILLQYIAGAFSLSSPCLQQIDRSRENISKFVIDYSQTKASAAAFPAMVAFWNLCCYSGKGFKSLVYETTPESEKTISKFSSQEIIPYCPVLEASRRYAEDRAIRK